MHLVHLLWVSKREELNRTNKISTFSFETFGIQLNFTVNTGSHLNFITIQFRLFSPNLKTNHASTTFSWQTPLILAVRFLQNFFFSEIFYYYTLHQIKCKNKYYIRGWCLERYLLLFSRYWFTILWSVWSTWWCHLCWPR